jgi:hypothetical protein
MSCPKYSPPGPGVWKRIAECRPRHASCSRAFKGVHPGRIGARVRAEKKGRAGWRHGPACYLVGDVSFLPERDARSRWGAWPAASVVADKEDPALPASVLANEGPPAWSRDLALPDLFHFLLECNFPSMKRFPRVGREGGPVGRICCPLGAKARAATSTRGAAGQNVVCVRSTVL